MESKLMRSLSGQEFDGKGYCHFIDIIPWRLPHVDPEID